MTSDDPNATAAESAVQQIGTEFRRLRALRGERLEDIAAYLDIKATYLFGIEQGDLSVIPSRREAKSIVRNYANYLGLDGDRIIGPMDPIIASLSEDRAPTEPQKKHRFDRTSIIILAASVLLGILVGWSWIGDVEQFDLITPPVTADDLESEQGSIDDGGSDGVETVVVENAPSTDDLSEEAQEAADALLAELKTALAEGAEATDGTLQSIAETDAGAGTGPKRNADPANVLAALVAERGDGAHIYESENTDARVIVRALTDVSVQVTSQSRDYVWTESMKPREMLLVPNRDDLELWTGNAGGIEVLLDGVILPPLGPEGTVISGLSLGASALEAISDALPDGSAKPTF